ncbi:UDP-glucose--hexose-1-phosphate uridylyltransferase [Bombilactobacillus bombi]|uniref:Galactose-1-phosphate uridylyltransferase n=1 Tax=Bombilactobacillus bombi TaxID=1303590 RepID=A0A417ZJT8_9LACO|nr:UDP-glucose--hexose-1-phosphate uridylyltransferase [Bombilactobacillus bombi]RHW52229.1 UDP-glucose--hexose-1-phosphate uridylyltransferase [Bombilactobacillus bombi]
MSENLVTLFADKIIMQQKTFYPLDRNYLINKIYALVGDCVIDYPTTKNLEMLDIVQLLVDNAVANQQIAADSNSREILACQLTDLYTPAPSQINQHFWNQYQLSPQAATDYFYQICEQNNYIKTKDNAKNISYQTSTAYGDLEITINLAKPEKDPKAIAAARLQKNNGYPADKLSMENEGYLGRADFPARTNHRIIRLTLGGETWGFQYSPYAYFNEHCIFLSNQQRPMHIDSETFTNLFEIVRLFPHYFVGSNADLPIVGGSVLSHDHYQGGRHLFPMMKAPLKTSFQLKNHPQIIAGIVNWPMSVIRLAGNNPTDLIQASQKILTAWQHYSDESVNVRAIVADKQHHTITPIVYCQNQQWIIDLVLRDNQTSQQYPDGIFHPHQDVQHIKKENIGLIEVMGRAILPGRLQQELQEVKHYLLQEPNHIADYHLTWAQSLQKSHTINDSNVEQIINDSVGQIFARVLEDAGVFKNSPVGEEAFQRFLQVLN